MLTRAQIKKAAEWRANNPELVGGVIVFHGRKLQGWVNKLRNPESWMPGVIALDTEGHQYIAAGGDDYNGAERWDLIVGAEQPYERERVVAEARFFITTSASLKYEESEQRNARIFGKPSQQNNQ